MENHFKAFHKYVLATLSSSVHNFMFFSSSSKNICSKLQYIIHFTFTQKKSFHVILCFVSKSVFSFFFLISVFLLQKNQKKSSYLISHIYNL